METMSNFGGWRRMGSRNEDRRAGSWESGAVNIQMPWRLWISMGLKFFCWDLRL